MDKKLRKLYKQTRIELPQGQSSELSQFIEAIENSNEGKEELSRIVQEGNHYKDGKGQKLETSRKTYRRKIERVSSKIKGKMVSFVVVNLVCTCNASICIHVQLCL